MIARIVGAIFLVLLLFFGLTTLACFVGFAFTANYLHAAFSLGSAIFQLSVAAWLGKVLYDQD